MSEPGAAGGRRGPARLAVLALVCSVLAVGLAVAAVDRATAHPGPDTVARQYYLALARGDAAGALALAAAPPAPGQAPMLTRQVLQQQLAVASIDSIKIVGSRAEGDHGTVSVEYDLHFGAEVRHRTDRASLVKVSSSWRLQRVSSQVRLAPARGSTRLTFAGRPVPSGPVQVFPGALPLRTDSAAMQVAGDDTVLLSAENSVVAPTVEVTAQARRQLAAGTQAALTKCLAPTSVDALCPTVTGGRPIPGSLRGTLTAPVDPANATITLTGADSSVLTLTATIGLDATWKAWDFNNQPVARSGQVQIKVATTAGIDRPGTVYWTEPASVTEVAPAVDSATPGPPEAPEWWFDAWKVPTLWSSGADGHGITVALLDTGVQASIPELSGRIRPGADFIGNGTDGRVDFDGSEFSHGTAMASLIVARRGYANIEGIAPAADILPVALPLRGVVRDGGTAQPNATSTAVRYAADHGAKIISMSLGGIVSSGVDRLPCPVALQAAIVYAVAKGSLVVAAAGNSGEDGSPVEEPGVCLGVVSVGAVDSKSQVSYFSSRHPYLTVTAPGQQISTLSNRPGSAFVGDGTSQATAIASGALALIWSKYPAESSRQILARLLGSVQDEGPAGRDSSYGLGVIDPYAAITRARPATAPDVVFDAVQPLLALTAAVPVQPQPKAAAGDRQAPLGPFRVGRRPAARDSAAILLGGLAAASALLAGLLWIGALRRWRSGRARPGSVHYHRGPRRPER